MEGYFANWVVYKCHSSSICSILELNNWGLSLLPSASKSWYHAHFHLRRIILHVIISSELLFVSLLSCPPTVLQKEPYLSGTLSQVTTIQLQQKNALKTVTVKPVFLNVSHRNKETRGCLFKASTWMCALQSTGNSRAILGDPQCASY